MPQIDPASLPTKLRFVRCGERERWRDTNFDRNQIHFGWAEVPHDALMGKDPTELKEIIGRAYFSRPFKRERDRKTAVSNSVRELLDALTPEKFTWGSIADGQLWWCTARPGINPNTESEREGHFFARCDSAWSNKSLIDSPLTLKQLAPSVAVMNRYQGTVCDPGQRVSVWRAIRGEEDPAITEFRFAREKYRNALRTMIENLHYSALEDLVDLIFSRAGYSRMSRVGGTKKDWDFESVHPEREERIAIQVKSRAGQSELADYEQRSAEADIYDRLYFVVARATGKLSQGNESRLTG
jgi:hypothetical protein